MLIDERSAATTYVSFRVPTTCHRSEFKTAELELCLLLKMWEVQFHPSPFRVILCAGKKALHMKTDLQ
jgi:hypothetical protein